MVMYEHGQHIQGKLYLLVKMGSFLFFMYYSVCAGKASTKVIELFKMCIFYPICYSR